MHSMVAVPPSLAAGPSHQMGVRACADSRRVGDKGVLRDPQALTRGRNRHSLHNYIPRGPLLHLVPERCKGKARPL
jgi:hypothetical protein